MRSPLAILFAVGAVGAVGLVAGCDRSSARTSDRSSADAAVRTTAASVDDGGFVSAAAELNAVAPDGGVGRHGLHALAPTPVAGKSVDIAPGRFASGSTPGDDGRNPGLEPALVDVTLGPFSIDALPYPNDPAAAPLVVRSLAEASKTCATASARLCTELEWERACKGPNGDAFATGAVWNEECDRAPSRCASGSGARAMGFMAEWTESPASEDGRESAILRGGPASGHRCAARVRPTTANTSAKKGTSPAQAAFRCCHGARNDVAIAPIVAKPAFRKTTIGAEELAAILAEAPPVARLSDGLRLFADTDVKTILSRSSAVSDGITFTTAPLLWNPEPGVELLVATGRAKRTGFVVALWTLPGGDTKYRFASSFLLLNDAAPIALAYEPSHRKELRWSTCWGCAGEQGGVTVHDDGRVVIVQY